MRSTPQHGDPAVERIRAIQTEWCGFDVGPPTILGGKSDDLLTQVPPELRARIRGIPVGVVHSHQFLKKEAFRARACQCSDGVRFIIIDYRLPLFLDAITRVLCAEIFEPSPNPDDARASTYEHARHAISELLFWGTLGEVGGPEQSLPPLSLCQQGVMAHHVWSLAQEYFILAHEYAHFILGHFDSQRCIPLTISGQRCVLSDGVTVDVFTTAQRGELEADSAGTNLVLKAANAGTNLTEPERSLLPVGLELTFLVFDFIEHILDQDGLESGKEPAPTSTASHPSGEARWDHWRRQFVSVLSQYARDIGPAVKVFLRNTASTYMDTRSSIKRRL